MELGREEWQRLVADTLVGAVVHIHEQWLPAFGQCFVIHSKAMVLRGDKTLVCTSPAHWLVVAAMAVFQFIGISTGSLCQQLIAHAYATDRFLLGHGFTDIFDRSLSKNRIAGAIAYKESIGFDGIEIVVPGHAHHTHATTQKAPDDIMLYAAVHQHHDFAA